MVLLNTYSEHWNVSEAGISLKHIKKMTNGD